MKFGFETRKSTNFEVNRPSVSGNFSFGTQPTSLPGTGGTGLALASLLLGFPNSFTLRETDALDRFSWYIAGYIQDDWKIHADLTLNLGLRWEADTPMTDRNNRMNGFDAAAVNPVSGTPGVARFAGIGGWPGNISEPDWNNFGPRFGFAWRPFGLRKTVVRGGGGVFFAHPFDHGAPASAALGFERSANLQTPDNGITAPFFLRDGVPPTELKGAELTPGFGAVPADRPTTTAVTFYERARRAGYAQQFTLGIQHELKGVLVELAYLGNLSRKLSNANISVNQVASEKITPASTQRDRPFAQFSDVSVLFPSFGVTDYHAATLKAERRFSRGLSLLGTYTFSRNIGDSDSGGDQIGDAQFYQDFYNRKADKGISELDITHRFTWSSVWELPFGRGRRWLSGSGWRHVVGGWTLGAISVLQSGPGFTVRMQTTSVPFLAGPQRPDLVRNPNLPPSGRTAEKWFDVDAFAPPRGLFGNAGTGIARGDGDINFDFSLIKNFYISEKQYVQFRAEIFNAFNHPNFGLPGRALGGPDFGIVTSANDARIIQFGLRAVF